MSPIKSTKAYASFTEGWDPDECLKEEVAELLGIDVNEHDPAIWKSKLDKLEWSAPDKDARFFAAWCRKVWEAWNDE